MESHSDECTSMGADNGRGIRLLGLLRRDDRSAQIHERCLTRQRTGKWCILLVAMGHLRAGIVHIRIRQRLADCDWPSEHHKHSKVVSDYL